MRTVRGHSLPIDNLGFADVDELQHSGTGFEQRKGRTMKNMFDLTGKVAVVTGGYAING